MNYNNMNNMNEPKANKLTKEKLIILGVIAFSCIALISGFLYGQYQKNDGSLFGSGNNSAGSGMFNSGQEEAEDTLANAVSPDTLLDWTAEAEDTLEEYVEEDDVTASEEEEVEEEETTSDSSSSSSNSSSSSDSSSNSSSNSSSDSSSNNSSSSDSNSSTATTSETLGKGEWLAKYYDGGVIRYYGDGSVYDMTMNIWWTKTQWSDFMASITV